MQNVSQCSRFAQSGNHNPVALSCDPTTYDAHVICMWCAQRSVCWILVSFIYCIVHMSLGVFILWFYIVPVGANQPIYVCEKARGHEMLLIYKEGVGQVQERREICNTQIKVCSAVL
jgi:hypothetical protein